MLYRNYNARAKDDVLFLHTGDVPLNAQRDVLELCAGGGHARFHQLAAHHFEIPKGTPPARCAHARDWLAAHEPWY